MLYLENTSIKGKKEYTCITVETLSKFCLLLKNDFHYSGTECMIKIKIQKTLIIIQNIVIFQLLYNFPLVTSVQIAGRCKRLLWHAE